MLSSGAAGAGVTPSLERVASGAVVDELAEQNRKLRRQVEELEEELQRRPAGPGGVGDAERRTAADRLTGLPGRDVLIDRLEHCVLRAARTAEQYAVLFCDLDGFKLVNDRFGHEAGDTVLVEVAARMHAVVRAYDTVARFGGDEFVILLENIHDIADVLSIAQRLVTSISEMIPLPGGQAAVGVSVGVVTSEEPTASIDAFLARADAAMYEAKRAGKGRVELFDSDLDHRLADRLALGHDLRAALDDDQLELWYRPVVSLDTGEITCVEGSARWNHPTRGLLTPETFVPIAYRTGLIEELDEFIVTTAATDIAAWRGEHPTLLAWITVSTRLLRHGGGPQHIADLLDRAGAPTHSIGIEVAEDAVLRSFTDSAAALHDLHRRDVPVALDNFSGHLTVPQLLLLRPDTVKLDRGFLGRLGLDVDAATAIRSISGMTRPLGISVVAKGVDTPQQLAAVLSLNCDEAQGAVTGQPMPAGRLDLSPADHRPPDDRHPDHRRGLEEISPAPAGGRA